MYQINFSLRACHASHDPIAKKFICDLFCFAIVVDEWGYLNILKGVGLNISMMNKRGFMRILEATIAVLIVSGVLIVVYAGQVDRGVDAADYFYSLQRQILSDISLSSNLRSNVLNVEEDDVSDANFVALNDFVGEMVPDFVGFSISICDLGSGTDYCRMNSEDFIATRDKDIFVEDAVISADLGTGEAVHNPRQFRLFMWEKSR